MLPPAPDPFGPLDLFGPFLGPVLPLLKLVLLPIWDTFWQVYVLGQVSTAMAGVGAGVAQLVGAVLIGIALLFLIIALIVLIPAFLIVSTVVFTLIAVGIRSFLRDEQEA